VTLTAVAVWYGFGIRKCQVGTFTRGPFCIPCTESLGLECQACDNAFSCADCGPGKYWDSSSF
jgi:hypothetical protein